MGGSLVEPREKQGEATRVSCVHCCRDVPGGSEFERTGCGESLGVGGTKEVVCREEGPSPDSEMEIVGEVLA